LVKNPIFVQKLTFFSPKEWKKGLNDFGIDVSPEEATEMFNCFDTDRTGKLSFDELLVALRPPMRKCRRDLVMKAFKKLDRTNTGEITIDDLRVRLLTRLLIFDQS